MSYDFLHTLLSNIWSIFLVVLFFGGSIFVHELGHFLAARRRGVHVERFSIGFGPKIFSWRGKDGVEYRISWLPLGGYVALPQLADLRGIEGDSEVELEKLPPITYSTKMIVFAAGAAFNVIFAFALASIIWFIGQPMSSEMATTRIGYVSATLDLSDGSKTPSPASQAGLRIGDTIRQIDGIAVNEWTDILQTLVTGAGRTASGKPMTVFTIERDGHTEDVAVYPVLSGEENFRRVGIAPGYELMVHAITAKSLAAQVGFQPGDEILSLNGTPILSVATYQETLASTLKEAVAVRVKRAGQEVALTIPPRPDAQPEASLGLALTTGFKLTHPSPFTQISDHVVMTFRTLSSLINPQSDIGLSKVAGPVGIVRIFHSAAEAGMRAILMFTILVNINLAIFNLLPVPVLDGGQMLFATIGKLRGRALPANFVMTTQGVFIMLLFSMILYISFFDVRRVVRDVQSSRVEAAAPAK
ncbi:MAG: RIP metalloprotease RseP [Opitutaceae bacterium]|nr:RIP metalloprotease RseP [Opitutaceae bacterium]MBP9912424.1 RIP metalloprotease RseP [Opitutaceae bacterium]